MEIPVLRSRHTDVAIALVAQCLEAYDGGVPNNTMGDRLDEIDAHGETPELVTALAFLAASMATAASQAVIELGGFMGVNTDNLAPEDILAAIRAQAEPLKPPDSAPNPG